MRENKRYRVYIPGHVHTWELYGEDESHIREQIRSELEVKRCPNDTFIELIDPEEERRMVAYNKEVNKDVLKANPWLCATDLM